MATVVMHQIKTTTSKAIAYISRPDATGDGLWVSTNAAVVDPSDWNAIGHQFEATTERVGVTAQREGSVLAHHVIQSFDPKEKVDAETAHRLGVQLAEQVTGGAHEYVIATHLDKDHVHNHIIFNATNMETGRKFRCVKSTIGDIRGMSDKLCKDAGLSVLPTPERATGRTLADVYRVLKGDSAKEYLRTEIDKAATGARTWMDFEGALFRAGIETSKRPGRNAAVTFRVGNEMRPVRDFRLGEAYTEDAIMARLSRDAVNRITFDQSMIVRENKDTIVVNVPGTGRKLQLTVSKTQVVRHGRTVRAFIPSAQQQMLSDRHGKLAKTVPSGGLYRWFSEPDIAGVASVSRQGSAWAESLAGLRQLQDQINAKARWANVSGREPDAALAAAKQRLSATRLTFQTRLVAATELVAVPERAPELRVVQAELRITEREIDLLRRDVQALTTLTQEEMKMSVSDRITAGVDERRRQEQAQQVAESEQAEDRQMPVSQLETEPEEDELRRQDAVEVQEQVRDAKGETREQVRDSNAETREQIEEAVAETQDGGSDEELPARPLTLAERIEAEAQRRAETDPNRKNNDRGPAR